MTECLPVVVEAPWHLDTTVPVSFATAHQDHAAYQGRPEQVSDKGFCVPLWAEGYGGTQLFGATVDAGMLGVISGTVEFGVVKNEAVVAKVPVSAGPINDSSSLKIPLPTLDKYEVQVKLRDGKEESFSESGALGKVAITWAGNKVELDSKKD